MINVARIALTRSAFTVFLFTE